MRPASIFKFSLLAALSIQAGPVLLKWCLDDLFVLDVHAFLILASLCCLQLALTTIPGRFGAFLGTAVLVLGSLFTLMNVMNIGIFQSPISIITLSTTFQSNLHETKEFLETYGSQLALYAGASIALSLLLIGFYGRARRPRTYKPALLCLTLSLLFATPIAYKAEGKPKQIALAFHELSYVDRFLATFMRYQTMMQAREKAQAFWTQRTHARQPLTIHKRKEHAPSLVVVVIGESTTRRHMGIYGYHRPTTPVLDAMKDQLLLFQNTSAPVASTLPGVLGALCASGFDRDSLECQGPTLIEIARAAGYRTSWISNQAPGGFGDNFIVELGRTTDTTHFVNQDVSSAGEADNSASYDEKILVPLEQLIQSSRRSLEKHMIFVHLMGTHFIYEKRYPKSERVFHSTDDIQVADFIGEPKAQSIINHYDNAIAYQDKVLGEILKRLNADSRAGLFVYFSDHGEEVFGLDNFAGHSEDRVTAAMREVPFIVGFSQSYAQKQQQELSELRKLQGRAFSTFQLTPSVAGLLGLEADTFRQQDNVFSQNFVPERGTMRASSSSPSQPLHQRN